MFFGGREGDWVLLLLFGFCGFFCVWFVFVIVVFFLRQGLVLPRLAWILYAAENDIKLRILLPPPLE